MMTNSMAVRTADPAARDDALPQEVVACPGNAFIVRARLADGRVDAAWSTGRMMRNMNVLLRGGLDAEGRPTFVQQAHCLCNDGHALAAIRALEDLAGTPTPRAARLVRSLVQALRCVQEHLLHFYQFRLADWADPQAALRADPRPAALLDEGSGRDVEAFRRVQAQLRTLFEARGETLPDGDKHPAHPDYRGPDAWHLLLQAHGLDALRTGTELHEALALLGCGPEGFRAYRPGGLPDDLDLSPAVLDRLRAHLAKIDRFVRHTFLPDLQQLAQVYSHWTEYGRGTAFFAWPDFAVPDEEGFLLPGGIVVPAQGTGTTRPARYDAIRENKEPAWNATDRDRYRLQPGKGDPAFTWNGDGFFWLPAPRHDGAACEAGPLARVLACLERDRTDAGRIAAEILADGAPAATALNSTLGRVAARGVECALLTETAPAWLEELETLLAHGAARSAELDLPAAGLGVGRVEVPRGGLTHTIRLDGHRIAAHDYLIPSLWNFSPRDADGGPGPLEQALVGTPVADAAHPLELLRTIHELDPCNTCFLVIEDTDSGRTAVVNAA